MLYERLNPCYMEGPVILNNLPDWLKNLETVDDFHIRCIKWMNSSLYIVLSG